MRIIAKYVKIVMAHAQHAQHPQQIAKLAIQAQLTNIFINILALHNVQVEHMLILTLYVRVAAVYVQHA